VVTSARRRRRARRITGAAYPVRHGHFKWEDFLGSNGKDLNVLIGNDGCDQLVIAPGISAEEVPVCRATHVITGVE
jgi:hypothetical protein